MQRHDTLALVILGLLAFRPNVNGVNLAYASDELVESMETGENITDENDASERTGKKESLNLEGLGLNKIPKGFANIPNLAWLNLQGNNIQGIPDDVFEGVPNLSYLNLANNGIQRLNLNKFSGLKKLKILILDGNGGYSLNLTTDLPALTHLYLRSSYLRRFESSVTPANLPMLTHLFVSDNNLERDISDELVKNMPYLRHIDLTRSGISDFSLNGIGDIESISIDENRIISLKDEPFYPFYYNSVLWLRGAKKLKFLSASNNNIQTIDSNAFQDTGNLLHLNLSHNRIMNIVGGTFSNLPLLQNLSLEYNELNNITVGLFTDLPSLTCLLLVNNKISTIHQGSFRSLPVLKTLSLANNRISMIEPEAFSDNPMLEELSLANNQLRILPTHWFSLNGPLYQLDLSDNQFSAMEDIFLNGATHLSYLYLDRNPLRNIKTHSIQNISQDLSISLGYDC